MDRLGAVEVLQVLLESGMLDRRWARGGDTRVLPPVEATDTGEGDEVVWVPDSSRLWA
jgi:hypothetical protein